MIDEEVNELAFFDSAFKAVIHYGIEIEANVHIFTKCDTRLRRQEKYGMLKQDFVRGRESLSNLSCRTYPIDVRS